MGDVESDQGYKDRVKHPVANALAACLKGARQGDKNVRRRVQGWIAFLTGGGFAVYVGIRLLTLAEEEIRNGWRTDAQERAELAQAVKELAAEVRAMRSESKTGSAVIMERLRGVKIKPIAPEPDTGSHGG
jgi:hypothetical protein